MMFLAELARNTESDYYLTGLERELQWGYSRWAHDQQFILSRWVLHLLLPLPQLWVRVSPHYMLTKSRNKSLWAHTEKVSPTWTPSEATAAFRGVKKETAPFNYFITFRGTMLKTPGVCSPILDLTPNLVCSNFSSGCKRSMNHLKEGLDHEAKHRCRYSAQYDNRIYTCKASTSPNTQLVFRDGGLMRSWVSLLNSSGLLWGREGGDSGSQNDSLVWLTVVWPGHLCLVWVSPVRKMMEMASLSAELVFPFCVLVQE